MTQPSQHLESVEPRQAEIENDEIVILGEQHVIGLVAAGDAIDRVVRLVQGAGEAIGQDRVVFDDENAHGQTAMKWRIVYRTPEKLLFFSKHPACGRESIRDSRVSSM